MKNIETYKEFFDLLSKSKNKAERWLKSFPQKWHTQPLEALTYFLNKGENGEIKNEADKIFNLWEQRQETIKDDEEVKNNQRYFSSEYILSGTGFLNGTMEAVIIMRFCDALNKDNFKEIWEEFDEDFAVELLGRLDAYGIEGIATDLWTMFRRERWIRFFPIDTLLKVIQNILKFQTKDGFWLGYNRKKRKDFPSIYVTSRVLFSVLGILNFLKNRNDSRFKRFQEITELPIKKAFSFIIKNSSSIDEEKNDEGTICAILKSLCISEKWTPTELQKLTKQLIKKQTDKGYWGDEVRDWDTTLALETLALVEGKML